MIFKGTTMEMARGDSESITVWLEDASGMMPLVMGDKVYFTVKRSKYDTAKIFQKVVTSFTDGKAYVNIAPTDTKTLDFGRYVYDVQVTFANGEVKTIVKCSPFILGCEVTYE